MFSAVFRFPDGLNNSVFSLHKDQETEQDDEVGPEQYHSLLVNVRSLTRFLNAHLISTTTIACTQVSIFSQRQKVSHDSWKKVSVRVIAL